MVAADGRSTSSLDEMNSAPTLPDSLDRVELMLTLDSFVAEPNGGQHLDPRQHPEALERIGPYLVAPMDRRIHIGAGKFTVIAISHPWVLGLEWEPRRFLVGALSPKGEAVGTQPYSTALAAMTAFSALIDTVIPSNYRLERP
jgi:hypothetical protein